MFRLKNNTEQLEIITQAKIFENENLTIHNDLIKMPDGTTQHNLRSIFKKDYQAYIAALSQGKLLLINNFNNNEQQQIWSIPTIQGDNDQPVEKAAEYYLASELKLNPSNSSKVLTFLHNNKPCHIILCEIKIETVKDIHPNIGQLECFDKTQCENLLKEGLIDTSTALSISAVINKLGQPKLELGTNSTIPQTTSDLIKHPNSLSLAFQSGIRSKQDGKSLHLNPFRNYKDHTDLHEAWIAGWKRGK